jgi:hypothetical protein
MPGSLLEISIATTYYLPIEAKGLSEKLGTYQMKEAPYQ